MQAGKLLMNLMARNWLTFLNGKVKAEGLIEYQGTFENDILIKKIING
jgi:hypothetical protein